MEMHWLYLNNGYSYLLEDYLRRTWTKKPSIAVPGFTHAYVVTLDKSTFIPLVIVPPWATIPSLLPLTGLRARPRNPITILSMTVGSLCWQALAVVRESMINLTLGIFPTTLRCDFYYILSTVDSFWPTCRCQYGVSVAESSMEIRNAFIRKVYTILCESIPQQLSLLLLVI